jgi:hypothetical protein
MEKEVIIRVQENPDYIKDQGTGAVLNTNIAKLKEYKLRKKQNRKINGLQEEVEQLKDLVRALIEGQKCQ